MPGAYSLSSTSLAEEVAVKFMSSNPEAIFLLNAADLQGSVKLLLKVLEYNMPVVVALNLSDVAARKGIDINAALLERGLGVPAVPTIAVKREGFDVLKEKLGKMLEDKRILFDNSSLACRGCDGCGKGSSVLDYWERAREIVARAVQSDNTRPGKLNRLGDALLRPWPGVPLAILVIILSLGVVVGAGKALRGLILLSLVNQGIVPLFESLFS